MTFDYDEGADVLYITFGEPKPCATEEPESGFCIGKIPYSGFLNGITIIDFSKRSGLSPGVITRELKMKLIETTFDKLQDGDFFLTPTLFETNKQLKTGTDTASNPEGQEYHTGQFMKVLKVKE